MKILVLVLVFSYINIQNISVSAQDTIFETTSFKLKELRLIDPSFFDKINTLAMASKCPIFTNKTRESFSIYIQNSQNDSIFIFIIKDKNKYQTCKDIGFIEIKEKTFFVRGDYVQNIFQINKNKTKVFYNRKILGTKHKKGVLPLISDDIDGNEEWTFVYFKGNMKLLDQTCINN
jgi:hypothetical protein